MPLTPAGRLGPYEIVSPLGHGGMGEVYLARDTRLGREVAIKALPDAFAHDPERLARFEREARVLASLKHPNIATIYGLEEANGQRYLVLEYVEGPTLAERLAAGGLPVGEALEVCAQIAAGVEAAHENGIVHRDLKPANVKMTSSGEVKVLDFGLAKGGGSPSSSGLDLSNSPTLAHQPTTAGVILGTAAYMSPEQARGRMVDRRTDIWSFGCVLYECLTGRALHEGETVSDLIAHILTREPDWTALPADTPARLRELLARCLRKDARERQRDIGDVRLELAEIRAHGDRAHASAPKAPARRGSARLPWAVAAAFALIAAAALILPTLAPRIRAPHVRFALAPPPGTELVGWNTSFAVSPDGENVALIATDSTGTPLIWLRPLDGMGATPIRGTENALELFWSPDSRRLGFFADGKLCTIAISGGTRQVLADAKDSRGGSWGSRGQIVYAPDGKGPLMSVPADGGDATVVMLPDSAHGETTLRYPAFLPDGDHFTFIALPRGPNGNPAILSSLSARSRRPLFLSDRAAVHVAPGFLVFVRRGQLMGHKCDDHGRLSGGPFPIGPAPDITGPVGSPAGSGSRNGVFVSTPPPANTRLLWFDASGQMTGSVPLAAGRYTRLEMSPDGRRAIVLRGIDGFRQDMLLVDLERSVASMFLSGSELPGLDNPAWSTDGTQVAFNSQHQGAADIFVKRVDDASPARRVHHSADLFKNVSSWTPDDRWIAFSRTDSASAWDLLAVPSEGGAPVSLVRRPFNETGGWYSPDGKWIAYVSDEPGRFEVFIAPVAGGPAVQVSTAGGAGARWRADGRALVIYNTDQTLRVVEISPGPPLRAGTPRLLMRLPRGTVWGNVTGDFRRILAAVPVDDAPQGVLMVESGWLRR